MDRLTEEQAKKILFNAQMSGYPNKNIPEILAPLYRYVEQIEAENETLRADNAMLIKANKEIEYLTNNRREEIRKLINGPMACNSEQADYLVGKGIADWKNVFSDPHPGAALLKELEQYKKALKLACEKLYDFYEHDCDLCPVNKGNNCGATIGDCCRNIAINILSQAKAGEK